MLQLSFYIYIFIFINVYVCVTCPKFINKLAINIRHFINIVIDIRDEIIHILMDSTPSTTKESGNNKTLPQLSVVFSCSKLLKICQNGVEFFNSIEIRRMAFNVRIHSCALFDFYFILFLFLQPSAN